MIFHLKRILPSFFMLFLGTLFLYFIPTLGISAGFIYLIGIIFATLSFGRVGGLFTVFVCILLYLPYYYNYSVQLEFIFEIVIFIITSQIVGELVEREKRQRKTYKNLCLELDKKAERSMLISDTVKNVCSNLNLKDILKRIMDAALSIIDAEMSSLWLLEKDRKNLICYAAYGVETEKIGRIKIAIGEGITGDVAKSGKPEIVSDVEKDPRYKNPLGRDEKSIINQLSVPLKIKDEVIGVLNVFNKREGNFNKDDMDNLVFLASEIAISIENSRLFLNSEKRSDELFTLLEITKDMTAVVRWEQILSLIMDASIRFVEATSGSLMLFDKEAGKLTIKEARGFDKEIFKKEIKLNEGIAGYVYQFGKPVFISNPEKAREFGIEEREDVKSSICVPLKIKEKVIGVLSVNSQEIDKFDAEDLNFLTTLADHAALSIERARLYDELLITNLRIMQALALALDARDAYTHSHSGRVTNYVVSIAKLLKLDDKEINALSYAATLHDIGKIGISDNVLNKPGDLTEEEFALIKKHTQIGANIIGPIDFLKDAVPYIYHHHERFDGRGYPGGLKGEEIPLGARILAVVDAYEAMTSDRPYRRALTPHQAIRELRKWSGVQFDPKVVEVFLQILEKELAH